MSIALRHARVRYGPLEALHGVNLAAPGPGLTVLLGRNGSGRTTVLRALAGTVPLSGGAVVWDGADVTRLPAYERARRGLCLVPERRAVFGSPPPSTPTHSWPPSSPAARAPSPAASSACSRSPAPCWHARAWCSSTNPRRACHRRSRHGRTSC
jgi:energy-coupling factor transporter ATP-binding protein EcfA2